MAGMRFDGIAKSYGRVEVLRDIDLEVADGEFVVLVGPSGCGKSTLLRMIAGLEPISGGELSIGGRRVNDVAPRDRDIAMVFQSYALYPHMSVARNMGFPMEIARRPKAERAGPVGKAAQVLGLDGLLDRFPARCPAGSASASRWAGRWCGSRRHFSSMSRSATSTPSCGSRCALEIARLHRRLGATTVYVTHDQVEAMTLADRIVVMNAGRIQQVGTPMELYDRPANRFVAGFIGSPTMNMVEGTTSGERGLRLGDGTVWPAPPGTATLGIRPEHLSLEPTDAPPITGELQVVERLGSDTNLFCEVPGVGPILARVHGNVDLSVGAPVSLSPQGGRLHPFDGDGRRIG